MDQPPSSSKAHVQREGPSDGYGGNSCSGAANSAAEVVPAAPSVANSSAAAKARVTRFDPYDWAANQYTKSSGAAYDARQRMAKFVQEMKKSKADDSTSSSALSEGFVSSKVAAAPQSKPTKRAGGHCGSAPSAKQQHSLESTAEGQMSLRADLPSQRPQRQSQPRLQPQWKSPPQQSQVDCVGADGGRVVDGEAREEAAAAAAAATLVAAARAAWEPRRDRESHRPQQPLPQKKA